MGPFLGHCLSPSAWRIFRDLAALVWVCRAAVGGVRLKCMGSSASRVSVDWRGGPRGWTDVHLWAMGAVAYLSEEGHRDNIADSLLRVLRAQQHTSAAFIVVCRGPGL